MVGPEGTKRISKIDTYLNVAEAFAYRSTCIKRKYGAVIVKDDVVMVVRPPEPYRARRILLRQFVDHPAQTVGVVDDLVRN